MNAVGSREGKGRSSWLFKAAERGVVLPVIYAQRVLDDRNGMGPRRPAAGILPGGRTHPATGWRTDQNSRARTPILNRRSSKKWKFVTCDPSFRRKKSRRRGLRMLNPSAVIAILSVTS